MVLFSLTFVRHGETLYNRRNIIQGQTDVPLSSLGERQAELVAHRLQNDRFTHIYSSDLSRAYKTAKIICDTNRVCRCDISQSKKLRERKFGIAEGQTSRELHLAAKRAKKRYIDHTPPGAESVQQLQERVQSFFQDICQMCIKLADFDEQTYKPAKIQRRNGGSLGRNSRHNKRLQMSARSQSFCGSVNNKFVSEMKLISDDEIDNDENESFDRSSFVRLQDFEDFNSKCKSGEYSYDESFLISSDDSNHDSVDLSSNGSTTSGGKSHSEMDDFSSSASSLDHVSVESDETLSDCASPNIQNIVNHTLEGHHFNNDGALKFQDFSDYFAHGQKDVTDLYKCPNISLSPSSHRLSSISSISSGRNSSFDEMDGLPAMQADILVVSHGGFIKETVRYFVDTLDCKIPGVKTHAMKVCPNCSISRFIVSLDEETLKPSVTCITIHDKDHLSGLDVPVANGEY